MHTPEGSGETDREAHCQPSFSGNSNEDEAEMLDPGLLFPVSNPSLLTQSLLRLRSCRGHLPPSQRRKREMTPTEKKDTIYWDKRHKNNEAAKRSREKRRFSDMLLEGQMLALNKENAQLRVQVLSLHYSINLRRETSTVSAASGLPSPHSPALVHYPTANIQPGLWGYSWGNPLSLLWEPQPPAPRGVAGAGLGPLSLHGRSDSSRYHSQWGHPRFFSPLLFSQKRAWGLEIGASAEAENAAHHQVVSTGTHPNIQESPPASTKAFLPFSHPLCPTSTLSPSSQPWLIPSFSQSAMLNNLLMSSCLASTSLSPNMPLYFPMGFNEDQSQRTDNPEGLQARFNTLSVELAQPRKYWSPDRSD